MEAPWKLPDSARAQSLHAASPCCCPACTADAQGSVDARVLCHRRQWITTHRQTHAQHGPSHRDHDRADGAQQHIMCVQHSPCYCPRVKDACWARTPACSSSAVHTVRSSSHVSCILLHIPSCTCCPHLVHLARIKVGAATQVLKPQVPLRVILLHGLEHLGGWTAAVA